VLNHYLGGDGHSYRNITAFTGRQNKDHNKRLEEQAKKKVRDEDNGIEYYTYVTKRATFTSKSNPNDWVENLASEMVGAFQWSPDDGASWYPYAAQTFELGPDAAVADKSSEYGTGMSAVGGGGGSGPTISTSEQYIETQAEIMAESFLKGIAKRFSKAQIDTTDDTVATEVEEAIAELLRRGDKQEWVKPKIYQQIEQGDLG
jgi:hypothetical protein